jgi:hypothetical protein
MMAKRSEAEQSQGLDRALEQFLRAEPDLFSIHDAEQGRLELHLSGTDAYIPRFTRRVMDKSHGAPIMAVETRTYQESRCVFITPVKPGGTRARKLRNDRTLGPATFAFGVPLRKLGLKIPAGRRLILPLTPLDTPDHGTVYWASLADVESEKRHVDLQLIAAVKQAKGEKAKVRRIARIRRHTAEPGTGTEA